MLPAREKAVEKSPVPRFRASQLSLKAYATVEGGNAFREDSKLGLQAPVRLKGLWNSR